MSDMKDQESTSSNRRDFLKLATVVVPATALSVSGASSETEAATPLSNHRDARMQDTAHTRAYFASTRF
jgi:hypothetical protein